MTFRLPAKTPLVLVLVYCVVGSLTCKPALADDAPASPDLPPASAPHPLRLGAIAGVGFPRPLAVEALVSLAGWVDLGAEYGVLPDVTIDGVNTGLWSLAADARVFPFRGAFFVGALAGRQHVGASTSLTVAGVGSATEQLSLDSWFVNPRIGFLWTSDTGLALGIDAGLQIPLGSSVTSSLPLALYPAAQNRANALGATMLPTVDLLRVGFMW
jgi:hypothetical protein